MSRDLRDPKVLGEQLLLLRAGAPLESLSQAYDRTRPLAPDWKGDGFMSSNPANHHSGTKQDLGDLTA